MPCQLFLIYYILHMSWLHCFNFKNIIIEYMEILF